MKVSVTDQCATLVQEDKLVQNSENIYTVEFIFDDGWDDYAKTVIFAVGSSNLAVLLDENNYCIIPAQCLKRAGANIQIGVYGVNGDKKKPTIWCKTAAILPGAGSGQMILPPTPDIYSQLMSAIGCLTSLQTEGKTLVDAINELKQKIDSSYDPEEDPENTATDEEVEEILDDIFGQDDTDSENGEANPNEEEDDGDASTATDEEVDDILNDVFGD